MRNCFCICMHMKLNIKQSSITFLKLMKTTVIESIDNNILKLAAALAYYTIFSLAPMLIIIIWISGIFYDPVSVQGELSTQLNQLLGQQAVKQIQEVMINTKFDYASFWAKTLGIITLVISATGIFGEIQDSINTIWGLKPKPNKGLIKFLITRLLSFSIIISLGFVLLVSLLLNAIIAAFTSRIQYYFPCIPVELYYVINQFIMLGVIILLFAAIFKVLPDAKIAWRDVMAGAVITAILFMLGKYVIGYYLGENATISAYGSAGAVIIILLWVYFSAIILYFGAEFTQAYLKIKNKHIIPNKYADWIQEKQIIVESNTEVNKENIPQ
jgi:membrane protein